jgi:streptomycin 6-kinase
MERVGAAANGEESKRGRGATAIHWGEGEGAARVVEERGAPIHRIEINGQTRSPL